MLPSERPDIIHCYICLCVSRGCPLVQPPLESEQDVVNTAVHTFTHVSHTHTIHPVYDICIKQVDHTDMTFLSPIDTTSCVCEPFLWLARDKGNEYVCVLKMYSSLKLITSFHSSKQYCYQ